jgi:hypothetical protein
MGKLLKGYIVFHLFISVSPAFSWGSEEQQVDYPRCFAEKFFEEWTSFMDAPNSEKCAGVPRMIPVFSREAYKKCHPALVQNLPQRSGTSSRDNREQTAFVARKYADGNMRVIDQITPKLVDCKLNGYIEVDSFLSYVGRRQ